VLDGRRAIVLVYADFDPSGWQMLTSIARKIQALRVQLGLDDLACDIYRVALTIEQVREFNLPSTPLRMR